MMKVVPNSDRAVANSIADEISELEEVFNTTLLPAQIVVSVLEFTLKKGTVTTVTVSLTGQPDGAVPTTLYLVVIVGLTVVGLQVVQIRLVKSPESTLHV